MPTSNRSPKAQRLRRVAPAVLALTSLAAFSTGPAVAAGTATSASLADWNANPYAQGSSGSGGWYGGGQGVDPWGDSNGSRTLGTAQAATAATAAQSKGVVLIDTVLGYSNAEAAGTGVVLTSGGEVLTNYHVVEGATSIKVTLASTGKTYSATVVGHDQSDDVAVLQLKGASKLATVTIDTGTVRTGNSVIAVGNAGGTDSLSAAAGKVTGLGQSITTEAEGSAAAETLHGLIETDANVVAGDSGGPLYDSQGEVVGLDTAASSGPQIDSYAIPIAKALSVAHQILSGHETSTVKIGASAFLGIEIASPASSQDGYGDSFPGQYGGSDASSVAGATISGVVSGGPAAAAGLQTGDTITAIGGAEVTSADQVSALMSQRNPGEKVDITWTDTSGTSHSATVTLAASPVD